MKNRAIKIKVITDITSFYKSCLTFGNNEYATFYINIVKNNTRLLIFSVLLLKKQYTHFDIIYRIYELFKNKKASQK